MIKENEKFEDIIRCPHCNKTYTLEEIFLPQNVFKGDLKEFYTCENCNMLFKVELKMSFKTSSCLNKLSLK